eukprot:365530-Chlamydomonas_euryale.AAC.14
MGAQHEHYKQATQMACRSGLKMVMAYQGIAWLARANTHDSVAAAQLVQQAPLRNSCTCVRAGIVAA